MPRIKPRMVSDELWERVKRLVTPPPHRAKGSRPPISDQRTLSHYLGTRFITDSTIFFSLTAVFVKVESEC